MCVFTGVFFNGSVAEGKQSRGGPRGDAREVFLMVLTKSLFFRDHSCSVAILS